MKRVYNVNDGNIAIKVSRKFRDYHYPDEYCKCVGSPSDIRKVCAVLDTIGYKRMYSDAPIMREGRTYQVQFSEYWHNGATYTVYRGR